MVYVFKGNDPYSSHSKILSMLSRLSNAHPSNTQNKNNVILDVGCATGFFAQNLPDNEWYGIELDKAAADTAQKYYKKLIVGDIETLNLDLKKSFFDVIICGDVLEHLKEPEKAFAKLLTLLKKGGTMILSTGNVANWYIRLNLLLGRFEYQDRGILDRTHCRLFTLKSFKKLVTGAGLTIKSLQVSPIPLPVLIASASKGRFLYPLHVLNNLITKLWKKLFGFQFIIECSAVDKNLEKNV